MAATLLHLKSRMLLPRDEPSRSTSWRRPGAGPDPRAELVRRLLEYQKYRDAAEQLAGNDLLDRDGLHAPRAVERGAARPRGDRPAGGLGLQADRGARPRAQGARAQAAARGGARAALSLSDAIYRIADQAAQSGERRQPSSRSSTASAPARDVVITFLALLEMCKLRLVRVIQAEDGDDILVSARRADALAGRRATGRHAGGNSTVSTNKPEHGARRPGAPFSEEEVKAATERCRRRPRARRGGRRPTSTPRGGRDALREARRHAQAPVAPSRRAPCSRACCSSPPQPLVRRPALRGHRHRPREDQPRRSTSCRASAARASSGVVLHEVAGGWQLRTAPESADYVRRFLKVKPQRLTRAALETLAIVAYRQPVTRPEIEDIRGVDSGAVLKALLERRLIEDPRQEGRGGPADPLRHHPRVPRVLRAEGPGARCPRCASSTSCPRSTRRSSRRRRLRQAEGTVEALRGPRLQGAARRAERPASEAALAELRGRDRRRRRHRRRPPPWRSVLRPVPSRPLPERPHRCRRCRRARGLRRRATRSRRAPTRRADDAGKPPEVPRPRRRRVAPPRRGADHRRPREGQRPERHRAGHQGRAGSDLVIVDGKPVAAARSAHLVSAATSRPAWSPPSPTRGPPDRGALLEQNGSTPGACSPSAASTGTPRARSSSPTTARSPTS